MAAKGGIRAWVPVFLITCGIILAFWGTQLPQGELSYKHSEVRHAADVENVKFEMELTQRYFSNPELEDFMRDFAASDKCGKISRLFSIGKSVDGTDLWVLEISDKPGVKETEPNFKYVANMHGDEPSGRQLLMKLASWLCNNYMTNPKAARIVDKMHLFLLPTMNPDGYSLHTRGNGNNVDLNRNFPDRLRQQQEPMVLNGREEPETLAIIHWIEDTPFVASGNLHEGALVANYPYDAKERRAKGYAASPDDGNFVYLAKLYASHHREMASSPEFPDGITNGNAWYPVYGGMQDWNYINGHCLEITLELSEHKAPAAATLTKLWSDNMRALLDFPIAAGFGGLSGVVREGGPEGQPLKAKIKVAGLDFDTESDQEHGHFSRVLKPATYEVSAQADGYKPNSAQIIVPTPFDVGIVHNFYLQKEESR